MTTVTDAARDSDRVHERSTHARALFTDLMAFAPRVRRAFIAGLDPGDLTRVLAIANTEGGTPFALWHGDPVGFVEQVLGETMWSKQREVLEALVGHTRVAVPAAVGVGKTHIAARAVLFTALVNPVGTSISVTIATRMRQVQRQMWPHIRRAVARARLPGTCDQVQWHIPDPQGVETTVAYGFTAPDYDESALQGVHSARTLLVVDEAGGVSRTIGRSTRSLLTGDAGMLAIGNPPTDDEGSWFEGLCDDGEDPEVSDTTAVRIAAADSPAISGEPSPACRECPPQLAPHPLSRHLADQRWMNEAIRDHGPDAPYVIAKVHARFPRGSAFQAIPWDWVEAAVDVPDPEPDGENHVRLSDLGVPGERSDAVVPVGGWVRLGVDVAADGGDEFAVARVVGDVVEMRHTSAGSVNAHPHNVAGKVLEEIRAAQQLAAALGSATSVRVKIDGIGVGWGVAGILTAWASEGMHGAEIVTVVVSEDTRREPDAATLRPYRKRDEMWLAGRFSVQPDPGGAGRLRLRLDRRAAAQLSAPRYGHNTQGYTVVESKAGLRKRGLSSPDRAEAVLLSIYEPLQKKRARLLV